MSTTAEKVKVMQAEMAGADVQKRAIGGVPGEWVDAAGGIWNWSYYEYQVTPKRPKEIWVNTYGSNPGFCVHTSESFAATMQGPGLKTTTHYREVTDD